MSHADHDRPANRLIRETSPYLLQHAYNPVDWYPWSPEALSEARRRNNPILLSIGYSACHWCHVMERESFEDPDIAALMNRHFVCIKVDREERPDLDEIYMQATLAMNRGHGGWPMTVVLTPEGEPFFAGTYFPPTDKWGRPGFRTILEKIAEGWKHHRDDLVKQAAHLTARLKTAAQQISPLTIGQAEITAAVDQFSEDFDSRYGGFGSAPKFPPATGLSFLLRHYAKSKNGHTLQMVCKTLDAMAAGGMYDHIGGGFARYSTDERWLVPHFEKMLYDNALLSRTYLEAYQVTGHQHYRRVATEIFDYILREMTSGDGAFYSATDADSEGEEGKFFVWTPEEIQSALSNSRDAQWFCAYYAITQKGNWEGKSIPNTPRSLDDVATSLGCSPQHLSDTLARVRPRIYEARLKRVPPGLDDKVIVAWNGMMIGSLAEGSRVLQEPRYLAGAIRAAEFILQALRRPDGGLYRTHRMGRAQHRACLEDYAFLAEALIDIYEAGGDERFLTEAVRLGERIMADFMDQVEGGFFTTAHEHEALILRSREGPDGATPSGNAVAASALARLSFHFARDDFRDAATKALRVHGQQIARIPRAFAKSLIALELLLDGPVELALIGVPGQSDYESLWTATTSSFLPHRIIAHQNPRDTASSHPLLQGKTLVEGKAALYICRDFSCQAPITDPQAAREALRQPTHTGDHQPATATLQTKGRPGHATPEGTAHYVSRMLGGSHGSCLSAHGYTSLGTTGLTTSRLGFGSYRVDISQPEHREALKKALREGCNLIDTSTNYSDGGSERLVGSILGELIASGELSRNEVIVVSKIGYIQGQNLQRAEARDKAGNPFPEIVKYDKGLWHCLHPEFLDDQLTLSLDRLNLATLDVCLLHNPEYFLSHAAHEDGKPNTAKLEEWRTEFYRRLAEAFRYFEAQVVAGRLQYYGVSSNTCTASSEMPESTSLSRMLDAAEKAAQASGQSAHHFRVLQLPMNLFEAGALLIPNTGTGHAQTVLELAKQDGIAVLVNRPLNAIPPQRGSMLRLADPPAKTMRMAFDTQQEKVAKLEDEYRQELASLIPYGGKGLEPKDFFSWAPELARIRPDIQNLQHWEQIEGQMIAPHVNQVIQVMERQLEGAHAERWQNWRERYVPEFLTLLRILHDEAADKNRSIVQAITNRIDPLLPGDRKQEPLSRKALWILASTPGVTCVLNGMRRPDYVDDSLTVLGWPPFISNDPGTLYRSVAKALFA